MSKTAELFIDCRCELGEGPLWNPLLKQLFWFDILNMTLFSADDNGQLLDRYIFDHSVSAAAIVDKGAMVIAGAGSLLRLDLEQDTRTEIVPLEADKPANRSNDGRVHPSGAFWIGTMGRRGSLDASFGAVHHYRQGVLTTLFDQITIPNSICFSPDGRTGYFTDTVTGRILKRQLDADTGLPVGDWELFTDTAGHRGSPDGSIVDMDGYLWNARWGGSCVVRHAPDGSIDRVVEIPSAQVTCPALGGPNMTTLYVTTAREHMTPEQLEIDPVAGSIFAVEVDVPGQQEALIRL